ncbi:MAG TPA: Mu transposase C-terminal domain-containing protein [Opitutaceae bacterium]
MNLQEIAPSAESEPTADRSAMPSDDSGVQSCESVQKSPFPEVGPVPLRVAAKVGPHERESDIDVGCIRMRVLTPFALARLGQPYEIWDIEKKCLVTIDRSLPLRPYAKELAERLGCGTDLIFEWVNLMCEKGPQNVVASELLKGSSSGGKGVSRLPASEEEALEKAVYQVCVNTGLKPGTKAATKAIRSHLIASGCVSRAISTATIRKRSMCPRITFARADAYERDHLHRIAGHPDDVLGLNSVVVIDTTTFTDEDKSLRVVNAQNDDLGPANVIFAVLTANRGIWSFRAFVGPQNAYLVGLTIKRGLVSKESLLDRYNISGIWPFHGKVGTLKHDRGSEFLNGLVEEGIKSRDIAIDDRSPPETPHHRGDLERFNRTAHVLFNEFMESDPAKRFLRPVNGMNSSKGILLKDLDRAMTEWIVLHYHERSHKGLGGDSPIRRMEKFVRGENGLPASGFPSALKESDELTWDFLCKVTRKVNQLGISFGNRRYVNPDLKKLLKLNSRSSELKIEVRFNPYDMGQVYVKIPDEHGVERICPVPWLPETQKYRPSLPNQQASINPSLWEWRTLFRDVSRGNTEKPTSGLAEALHAKKEADAAAGKGSSGSKRPKERKVEAVNREMRGEFGKTELTVTSEALGNEPHETDLSKSGPKRKPSNPIPELLETACGADAY